MIRRQCGIGGMGYIYLYMYIFMYRCCSSIAQSCPTLCDPMDCSMLGLTVPHHLLEFAQVHVHCISDANQPSHPLIPSSPSALNLSQHQGLFQLVGCSHQMTKILELQFQHQSFQQLFRLISLKIDWFDLLAVQRTFKNLLQHKCTYLCVCVCVCVCVYTYMPTIFRKPHFWWVWVSSQSIINYLIQKL